MPEQIKVDRDLPGILKEYTKAVIRAKLENKKAIITFSSEYFKGKCNPEAEGSTINSTQ